MEPAEFGGRAPHDLLESSTRGPPAQVCTSYVQQLETHRAQQKKAATKAQQKAANKKSGGICTPFAHGAPDGRSTAAGTTAKNRAKSLN